MKENVEDLLKNNYRLILKNCLNNPQIGYLQIVYALKALWDISNITTIHRMFMK